MVSTYRILLAIQVSSFVNRLIYYIRRIPWIGKLLLPDTLYARTGLKKAASIAVFILGLFWAIANKFIYLGFVALYPVYELSDKGSLNDSLPLFLNILLPLSFGMGCIWNARVLETKRDKYIAVKLMRVRADRYMKATLTYRYVLFFISFLIALLVFIPLFGGTSLEALLVALSITMWRLVCEYGHLKLFERTGIVLIKNNAIVWLSIAAGGIAAYVPALLGNTHAYGSILVSLPAVAVVTVLGVAAAVLMFRYKLYLRAVNAATKRDDPLLNLGKMISDAQRADVESKAGDFDTETVVLQNGKASRRQGHDFLNELFFTRHRRLIRKPLLARLAIIGGAGAVGSVVMASLGLETEGWSLAVAAVFLPVLMFQLTVGDRLCRALFYNCDMPLMRYSFYREAAWRHFRIRLLRLCGMNLITGAALAAASTIVAFAAGMSLSTNELLLLWALILILSLLFSVHHLALYYLLQPYTTEMNSKNPLFFGAIMVVSAACWIPIILQPSLLSMTVGAAIVLVVYLLVAGILVRRIGPRTFRVK
ncbi:hypothetical protein [Paenibacillus herberti]|uniref:Uncharacterized protein n=1 Tax=Paenibacillus herberti TaxID=1619309 RepID=A0A229NXE1_9BACL|nr:hypothetical protein [Paenibacillus herberti]OXM14666.1 hypothetical protein CGZ75_17290 [Paenibacillus herberti]